MGADWCVCVDERNREPDVVAYLSEEGVSHNLFSGIEESGTMGE